MRKLMTGAIIAIGVTGLAVGASLLAQSAGDQAKEADIRRLMEILGSDRMGQEIGNSILQEIRPALEQMLPSGARRKEILARFEQKLGPQLDSTELSSQIIALYNERLTHKEILDMVDFYQSALGRKMLEVMPAIMQESQGLGAEWSEAAFQRVITEMEKEFPELKDIP